MRRRSRGDELARENIIRGERVKATKMREKKEKMSVQDAHKASPTARDSLRIVSRERLF